jgi:hypothetical protein
LQALPGILYLVPPGLKRRYQPRSSWKPGSTPMAGRSASTKKLDLPWLVLGLKSSPLMIRSFQSRRIIIIVTHHNIYCNLLPEFQAGNLPMIAVFSHETYNWQKPSIDWYPHGSWPFSTCGFLAPPTLINARQANCYYCCSPTIGIVIIDSSTIQGIGTRSNTLPLSWRLRVLV